MILISCFSAALSELEPSLRRPIEIAKELVPHLVESETPWINFLRTESYNPVAAAKRLALYWKYRQEWFGERWLLPMVQTGRGALTVDDVQLLRTGWQFPYAAGLHEYVYVVDRSKLYQIHQTAKAENWDLGGMIDRCCLYLCTIHTNPMVQTKGATLVQIVHGKCPRPPPDFRTQWWQVIRTALPIKFRRAIVVQAHEPSKHHLLEYMRFQTAKVVAFNSSLPPIQVYGDSIANIVKGLKKAGLNRKHVPQVLGGAFDWNERVAAWTRARLSVEELAHPLSGPLTSCAKNAIKKSSDSQAKTTIQERNALYSRRLYHKRKLQILSLQEECKKWQDGNKRLRIENARLETLWQQAQMLVCSVSQQQVIAAPMAWPTFQMQTQYPLHQQQQYNRQQMQLLPQQNVNWRTPQTTTDTLLPPVCYSQTTEVSISPSSHCLTDPLDYWEDCSLDDDWDTMDPSMGSEANAETNGQIVASSSTHRPFWM